MGHAREGRRRQFAEHVIVADAHHGHLVWNSQPVLPAGVDQLHSLYVARGHHTDRLGQAHQPAGECLPLLIGPSPQAGGGPRWREDVDDAAKPFRMVKDRIVRPTRSISRTRAEGELPHPAIDEMPNNELHRGVVVGIHTRQPLRHQPRAHVDNGPQPSAPGPWQGRLVQAADQAVARPTQQPLGNRGVAITIVDRDPPTFVLAHPLGNACKHTAAEGGRRFHDDAHIAVRGSRMRRGSVIVPCHGIAYF